jgi:hypothetical protein
MMWAPSSGPPSEVGSSARRNARIPARKSPVGRGQRPCPPTQGCSSPARAEAECSPGPGLSRRRPRFLASGGSRQSSPGRPGTPAGRRSHRRGARPGPARGRTRGPRARGEVSGTQLYVVGLGTLGLHEHALDLGEDGADNVYGWGAAQSGPLPEGCGCATPRGGSMPFWGWIPVLLLWRRR